MTAQAKKEKNQELRQQAEAYLQMQSTEENEFSAPDLHHLIHDLQVYQVELEIQNQELRSTQEKLERARDKYSDLYDFAPVGYLTIDKQGLILEANLIASTMLGIERAYIIDQNMYHFIAAEAQDNYYLCRRTLFKRQKLHGCKIKIARDDGSSFHARIQGIPEKNNPNHARIAVIDMTEQSQIETELTEVRAQLADIREMARQHLARELHDQVVQELIGLRYQLIETQQYVTALASADQQAYEKLTASLKSFDRQVLNVSKELRQVIRDLRPAGLEEFGLTTALEGYLTQLQRQHSGLWLSYKLDKSEPDLPYRISLCLFRVAQEAVRNALKHAEAHEITVRLHLEPTLARLEVCDNGKGFNMPTGLAELAQHGHFGLVGIAERVELVKGNHTINSTIEKGTDIIIQVPLNREEKGDEQ